MKHAVGIFLVLAGLLTVEPKVRDAAVGLLYELTRPPRN